MKFLNVCNAHVVVCSSLHDVDHVAFKTVLQLLQSHWQKRVSLAANSVYQRLLVLLTMSIVTIVTLDNNSC